LGYVDVRATLGSPKRTSQREIEFLVDTGAFHSAISKELATDLELEAADEISITLADKRGIKAPISLAYMKVLDRESILPVVMIDVPKPLLGTTALEGLGLEVDPVSGKLEHSRAFGVALL
jgi:clan AA aspartic protease